MIALKQPSLNEQLDFDKLILFRNGVTSIKTSNKKTHIALPIYFFS